MAKKEIPAGVYTAIVTPFLDNGHIDWDSFDRIIESQLTAGITGIVISGSTGEAPTLTSQEKLSLIKRARSGAGQRLHIMAGTGGNNTQQSIELTRLAADSGADSFLVVTPPYNKPSQKGLLAHFSEICRAIEPLPVCLYHVPGRTAQRLTSAALLEIGQIDNIAAIKEASADLSLFTEVAAGFSGKTFTGDDPTYVPSLAAGGAGVISVASNLTASVMVQLFQRFHKGDVAFCRDIHQKFHGFFQSLFLEPNPTPVKALMARVGLIHSGHVRLPLVPPEPGTNDLLWSCYRSLPKEWQR